jgi:hypothetical protein
MTEWFTRWLVWLFGIELPPAGEGVQWQLEGAWRYSRPVTLLIVIFGVAAAAYVIYFYFRERSSAGRFTRLFLSSLRLSLIALVLLVMLFELRLHFSRTSLPYLAVVIDESGSMEHVDDFDDEKLHKRLASLTSAAELSGTSRFDIARALLLADDGDAIDVLTRRYTLKFYTMADTDRRHPSDREALLAELKKLEATGENSKLGASLRGILNDLRGTQPAAVVIVTDGITTEGPTISEVAVYARRKAVPLYVLGVGSEMKIRSLEFSDLLVDDIVFVNDYVDFDIKLIPHGLQGRVIEIVLKDKQTGEILARKEITAEKDGTPQREQIAHRPTKVGTIDYVVEVVNLKEEVKGPRFKEAQVEVLDDPIKVLLVQAYPSFEYKYLKNLLERDDTIEFNVVLQEADIEYAEDDRHALRVFPVSRDKLFEYDVLILGDVNVAYFSPSVMSNIADFVKVKGGGLLFVSGERFSPGDVSATPLASLLPIDLDEVVVPRTDEDFQEGFSARPSVLGLMAPHMQLGDNRAETESLWRNLPEIFWMVEAPKVQPWGDVLAEHPTRTGNQGQKLPLMVSAYVPPGKVLWHATDETYRWRFRIGDALFARYWVQTIRYLSRSKLRGTKGIELKAGKDSYQRGTAVDLRVRFFDERLAPAADDGVTVVVEGDGTKKRRIKLQRSPGSRAVFEGEASGLTVGNYTAWIAVPSVDKSAPPERFAVTSPPGEKARKEMDVEDLKKAAERSRGRYFDVTTMDDLIDELPRGRPVKIATIPPEQLWNKWPVLTLFLFLLVGEWLLRKRMGML